MNQKQEIIERLKFWFKEFYDGYETMNKLKRTTILNKITINLIWLKELEGVK